MTGIYRLYNMVTGQSYIGQSRDITKRIEEHFYHRRSENASEIDKDIRFFGIHNFMIQIIELCEFKDLDWKEEYYINYFRSNIYGYNRIEGGQHNNGNSNPNAKLTSQDVYNIREAYDRHENPQIVYENHYKDKISLTYFYNVWEGKSWENIHMDVYNADNRYYYKNLINDPSYRKKKETSYRFSDEEVLYYRQRYVNETAEEIYNSIAVDSTLSAFKSMLNGNSYKHIPIYLKKKKIWINE